MKFTVSRREIVTTLQAEGIYDDMPIRDIPDFITLEGEPIEEKKDWVGMSTDPREFDLRVEENKVFSKPKTIEEKKEDIACHPAYFTQLDHFKKENKPKPIEKLEFVATNIDGTANIGVEMSRNKINEIIETLNHLTNHTK